MTACANCGRIAPLPNGRTIYCTTGCGRNDTNLSNLLTAQIATANTHATEQTSLAAALTAQATAASSAATGWTNQAATLTTQRGTVNTNLTSAAAAGELG